MVRQTWATKEQKDWLESKKAAFVEAKQKGNAALKELFFEIFRDFRIKFPVSAVTEDEIAEAGSIGSATKRKNDKYDKVYLYTFISNPEMIDLSSHSACASGFTTILVF
jgi:hypothetical protein